MTVERLQQARALITDPEHWTRFELAKDANGHSVAPAGPWAVRWCATGAVEAVGGGVTELNALTRAAEEQYGHGITDVNDHLGHRSVLLMFDIAIEATDRRQHDPQQRAMPGQPARGG